MPESEDMKEMRKIVKDAVGEVKNALAQETFHFNRRLDALHKEYKAINTSLNGNGTAGLKTRLALVEDWKDDKENNAKAEKKERHILWYAVFGGVLTQIGPKIVAFLTFK